MNKSSRIARLSLVLFLFIISGCAAPRSQFILMPSPDGHTGKVTVTSKGGTATLEKSYESTGIASTDAAPSTPALMSEENANRLFQEALAAHPAVPVTYLLYFINASSTLTADSEKLLPEIMAYIRWTNSTDISISGHSDKLGPRDFNIKLSRERAETVARRLIADGIPRESLEVASYGMELPLVDTPEGVAEPRNRRVEIVVR